MADATTEVEALLRRSHRLGADPTTTNYAGGNTSVTVVTADPVSGDDVEVMWVKGSGGDLGTLTHDGLAALRMDRLRALTRVYRGEEHEDEMVALLDHCTFGPGDAAPSIDTAMHGLLPPSHVDHLHPDSGIAFAAAADGERLTKECFGGEVGWLPWRRPGFELALQIAALHELNPAMKGVILGGHGITAWGSTSDECEANSLAIVRGAAEFIAARGVQRPFGGKRVGYEPLGTVERRARAAQLLPVIRGLCSTDVRMVAHFDDDHEVLEFLETEKAPALAALGTSCPDHFLRTKVRPLFLDLPASASHDEQVERLSELHAEYRRDYRAYYDRYADPHSPPMRGADPAIVLLPGIGMVSFGADKQTARIAGEFYRNAIRVMRGAEAVSTYQPIPESEKFRIEYWALEEAKLARRPRPKSLTGRVALVTGAGSGIGRAIAKRLVLEGSCVVATDLDAAAAAETVEGLGSDQALALKLDVTSESAVRSAFDAAALAFGAVDIVVNNAGLSISRPLTETTTDDWDRQHAVMARGSFIVAREAARSLVQQGGVGGDIIYIVSKNAVFAGPANIAYGAAKADQAHQVRLLAAELGEFGVRVNGINPDGVVAGSGIFANGWGAQRAAVYGVPIDKLGEFYAQRTLLKSEVLPEHVADAVIALTGGQLSLTTGTIIPVDGGVPGAFLR